MSAAPDAVPARYRRNAGALWRVSADVLVVLPPGAADPVVAPEPAATVWQALRDPASLEDLAATLADATAAPVEVVAPVVAEVLGRLRDVGVVEALP